MEAFLMMKKKTEIAKLTEQLIQNQNIEGVADLIIVLIDMFKQGVEAEMDFFIIF